MSAIDFGVRRPDDYSPLPDNALEQTVIPQFELMVERHPDRPAIRGNGRTLTYRQFNNAVNHLARAIVQEMEDNGAPVAFLLEDDCLSWVASMAIWKSGRASVGLYPEDSEERLSAILTDATAVLVITSQEFLPTVKHLEQWHRSLRFIYLDEAQTTPDAPNLGLGIPANAPCALYYTSGTTGAAKGVLVGHRYPWQSFHHLHAGCYISPSDRISCTTSACFARSIQGAASAFTSGALLSVFNVKSHGAQETMNWIEEEGLTFLETSPSIFRAVFSLVPAGVKFPKLRVVGLGGEPVSSADFELFRAHTSEDCILINTYASSEAGVICCYPVGHRTPAFEGLLPAGYPVPLKQVLLLDDEGQPVAEGAEGEIVVRSRFTSLGYWNQPEETALKLRVDPSDPDVRISFSGDRGRWRPDGALETTGRRDSQVKLRGFRVQLETIDVALRGIPEVQDAATIVQTAPGKVDRLVAYIAFMPGKRLSSSELRSVVSARLPSYMVPAVFVELDALPRTGSGKLARQELPGPSGRRPQLETPYLAPRNELESKIESIWESVLGLTGIGVNDSFFELGGDSLMTLEMTLQVERELGREVPSDFFKLPTIASLAELMAQAQPGAVTGDRFVLASHRKDRERSQGRGRRRSYIAGLRKLARQAYSAKDPNKLIDLLVSRHVVNTPFPEAREWSVRWSQNPFVVRVLYRARYDLFARFLESLPSGQVSASKAFPLNVLTNLSFNLTRFFGSKTTDVHGNPEAMGKSPYAYWRTLGQLLDAGTEGGLGKYFDLKEEGRLLKALAAGRGVILVSFHGLPNTGRLLPLERMLRLEPIATVSYHVPRRQSKYRSKERSLPDEVAQTMNAEIALFGQRRLQEGKIIQVLSDTTDLQGRTYGLAVGDRLYQFKAGFAELALNTGAAIIPHWRYFLPDGRLQHEFGEPFDPGTGDRGERVEWLLRQYASFVERTWAAHPEAMRWYKMMWHLKKPGRELPV